MASHGGWVRAPLETATEYAALGLALLPECPPTCSCSHPGKRPWDPLSGCHMEAWQQRGLPRGADLDAWLAAPDAAHLNIGCRCGPGCRGDDGLIGGDADGDRGIAELAAHLGLPAQTLAAAITEYRESGIFRLSLGTATYLTQSGGLRPLWRVPPGAKLHTVGGDKGHQGLRLMWEGSQVVLPPSTGPDGSYRWLPGYSPWQVGFGEAPASVLSAMAGRRAAAASGGVTLPGVAAYPACRGALGPYRDGRLMDTAWLPYDQGLLRDGVEKGERSESVFHLVGAMARAGWNAREIASVLWSAVWIRVRYGASEHLVRDVIRVMDKLQAGLSSAATAASSTEDQHTSSTGGAAHRHGDAAACGTNDPGVVGSGSAGTPPPNVNGSEAYDRRERDVRLRSYSGERDEAVRDGLRAIQAVVGELRRRDDGHERLLKHTARTLDSYDRCRTEAWGHPHDLRDQHQHADAGGAWLWANQPCDARGHEECAPYHAVRELRDKWEAALDEVYGRLPVAVLALTAPGWGLEQTHKAASALLKTAKVRHALGLCTGYLTFEPGAAPGYALHLIVPAHRPEVLRPLLLKAWRGRVPCGWARVVDDLPPGSRALETLVELRVRSEQAILLALGGGQLEAGRAVTLYGVETGAFSDSAVGGQKHRLVLSPGMRKLAKDLREGGLDRAAAAGDSNGAGREAAGPGAQGQGGTAPTTEGIGTAGAIPSDSGGATGEACAAGDSGDSAASESSGGNEEDDGWVPCPWDPTLEMRPSRDPQKARALPWFTLQKMAERGELVPLIVDGQMIGYRTPPGRGRRP